MSDGIRWDKHVRGLGLRTQAGLRTWVVDYRVEGKRRRITIGRVADVKVEDARKLARRRIGEAAHDRDPIAELRTITVDALLDHFEQHHRTRVHGNEPRADRDTAARLDLIRERWGSRKAGAIRYTDVATLLASVHGPYAQNRLRALVRSIWNRARKWGLIPATVTNPAEGTTANPEHPRTVRALSTAELARVITVAGAHGRPGLAISMIATSGCRPREILALRWADVDLDAGTATLRRRKGGDDLVLALGAAVVAVLAATDRGTSPWLFPGRRKGAHVTTVRDTWALILAEAKLPAGTRVRDLRAAALTIVERRLGLKAAQVYGGHTDSRTTLRYVRPPEEQRRESANVIEAELAAEIAAAKQRDAGRRSL